MNRKKKINKISNLLSDGHSVINKYINNQEEFQEAESNGSVNDFLDSQNYLDETLKNNLKLFYFIQKEISEKYNSHHLVLSSGISDLGEYYWYYNMEGIVSIKEYLDIKLKEDDISNRFKIFHLIEQHIKLIEDNLDDLSFFLEQESVDNNDLIEEYENENSIGLSYEILKKINPKSKSFLDLDKNFSYELLVFITKELFLELAYEYNEDKATQIIDNLEERLSYLTSNNSRENLAHLALIIDQGLYHSDEFEMIFPFIYRLASLYKDSDLIEEDVDVLIKLYEYIIYKASDLNLMLINPNSNKKHFDLLNNTIRNSLGDLYVSAWEKEKAINIYKEAAKYWSGDIENIESAISKIETAYTRIGYKFELINFLIDVLTNPSLYFQIKEPTTLSKEFHYFLTANLSIEVAEYDFSPSEIKSIQEKINGLETPILNLLDSMIKKDEINDNLLETIETELGDFFNKSSKKYELDKDYNSYLKLKLNILRIVDPTLEKLEQALADIYENEEQLNEESRFLYMLLQAKYKFHKNDISCIEEYINLIDSELFGITITSIEEQNYWYRECLRAISLNIFNEPSLSQKVLSYVKKKLDNAIVEYYEANGTRAALFFIQEQVEECVRAVLESIEKSHDPDFLFHILYSILCFKNKIILWKSQNKNIINDEQYNNLNDELKNHLASMYFYNDKHSKKKIEEAVFGIRKLTIPELRENTLFNLSELPTYDTTAYYIFTKRDNEYFMLILKYRNQNFSWEVKNFMEVYNVFINAKNQLRWEFDSVTLLTSTQEYNKTLSNILISEDHTYQRLNALFGLDANEVENMQLILDGPLYNIPFEMLRIGNSKPLGVKRKLITNLNKEQEDIFIKDNSKFFILSEVNELPNFESLIETRKERKAIEDLCNSKFYKYTSLFGRYATVENFKNQLCINKPNIIHISVHGKVDEDLTYETACLILEPSNNIVETSLLNYNDIINLDLSFVDLVVLSGCNTASGDVLKGSPMIGLAYGFLVAGAKLVLASKTKVGVDNTVNILNNFYNYLLEDKKSIQEAFRCTLNDFYDMKEFESDISSWSLYS
jgi:CHAT domain-containing protein